MRSMNQIPTEDYDTTQYTFPTFHQHEFDFGQALLSADAALAKLSGRNDPPLFDQSTSALAVPEIVSSDEDTE